MVTRELTDAEVEACRVKASQKFTAQLQKIDQELAAYKEQHPETTTDMLESKRYTACRNGFDNALICARRNGDIFYPKIEERDDDANAVETFEMRQGKNPQIDYKGNLLGAMQAQAMMEMWRAEMKKMPLARVNGTSVEFNHRSAQCLEEKGWINLGIVIFKTGTTPDLCPARVEESRLPNLMCKIAQYVSGILFLTDTALTV